LWTRNPERPWTRRRSWGKEGEGERDREEQKCWRVCELGTEKRRKRKRKRRKKKKKVGKRRRAQTFLQS